VVNKTGMSGNYDWSLRWRPERNEAAFPPGGGDAQPVVNVPETGPALFTALEEQLGLKLKPQKDKVETMAIDHVEAPSEN
jgi:uncharacterized protein (TIGR03435 family)